MLVIKVIYKNIKSKKNFYTITNLKKWIIAIFLILLLLLSILGLYYLLNESIISYFKDLNNVQTTENLIYKKLI